MDMYLKKKELGRGTYGSAYLVVRKSESRRQLLHRGQFQDRIKGNDNYHNDSSEASNKNYVIKEVILGNLSMQKQQEALKEAKILSQLKHANIVSYVDSFVENSKLHIVMDYADGGDLAQAIEKRKSVSPYKYYAEYEIMAIFIQICLGLRYVHSLNILHRDMKTGNIFLTSEGIVKLGDFGISKEMNYTEDLAKTQIGTPYYLSPEICNSEAYGKKSDIWSIGIILYQLITLELPFQGSSLAEVIRQICSESHKPINVVKENQRNFPDSRQNGSKTYSRQLGNLVDILLHKEASSRPSVIEILRSPFLQDSICFLLNHTQTVATGGAEGEINLPSQEEKTKDTIIKDLPSYESYRSYDVYKNDMEEEENYYDSEINSPHQNHSRYGKNLMT